MKLKKLNTEQPHTTRHFQPACVRDKFRIFLKSGSKNVAINQAYNEKEPIYRHVWVMFCVAFYRASYKLTDIECSIVAYYKWATKFNLTILTQRVLAKQLGISTSTLILALPKLVDLGILIRIINHKADYSHGNAKCFRYIYKWNPFCESGLKKFKSQIDTLKKSSSKILNRTVPQGVKSQNSCNKNTRLAAPHIQLAGCWWEYGQHFHRSEEHNLKKTIYHALKMGIRLPKLEDIEKFCAAIKKAATIPFLKQAHLIGWKEASKSRLVERGGEINDGSKAWGKYGHSRLNFIWLLKHWPDVLAGEYDERALSEKAKRTWEEVTAIQEIVCPRIVATVENVESTIHTSSMGQDEQDLRLDLLRKHGEYAYDAWFKGCGYDAGSGNLMHSSDFHRYEIERKYGVRVI